MAWEKLYVAEHEMAFRFFAQRETINKIPFQFFLICTRKGEFDNWVVSLAQEDPQNCEAEIRIADRPFVREYVGAEMLQRQARGVILWATNFINANYRLSIPAVTPDELTDELYTPK